MFQPNVAIIITCYNYGLYLEDALKSALNQTYQPTEVVIVDDGSTDSYTKTIWIDLKAKYPQISFLSKPNGGPSSARNYGITHTNAEIIMVLDGDDILNCKFVEHAVRIFELNENLSPLYSDVTFFGESEYNKQSEEWEIKKLKNTNFITTGPVFYKKAWLDVGGYDSKSEPLEDYELYLSLAQKGYIGKRMQGYLLQKRYHPKAAFDNFNSSAKDREPRAVRYIKIKHTTTFKYKVISMFGLTKFIK